MKRILFRKSKGLLLFAGVIAAFILLYTGLDAQMRGGGGCGPGGSIIDPPVGAAFKDLSTLPNQSGIPGVVEVSLDARYATVNLNGTNAKLMTYNGLYPGPVLRYKVGDSVIVHLTNSLPATTERNYLGYQKNFTNLHTHGWHVSPNAPADYVMYELAPGGSYTHTYDTSLQDPGTVCLYHPHKHGLVGEQVWAGLIGPLVAEDPDTKLAGYETHLMLLKDIGLSGGNPAPHSSMMDFMMGKEGNIVTVNGQVNPRLTIKKGQVQRWRIVNASQARFYKIALDNHSLQLIGTDGGLLDKPYQVPYIILSPAERVDVLVKATQSSGSYKFKSLPYSRGGCGGCKSTGQTITLMTVTYSGTQSPAQSFPAVVNAGAARLTIDTANLPHKTFTLSMGSGQGFINGQNFDADPLMSMSNVGDYEVWTIVNQSGMDHPWHQHVDSAQVLSISGGDSAYKLYASIPARKDVTLIPKMGSATILVPVMDYAGMTMFHCHILEHEDIGMMGMWMIMDMPM